MRNPRFKRLLDHMLDLHDRKNSDYARSDNPYSNFDYSATVIAPFTQDIDRAFVTLISTKLARIAELRKGKVPQNESLQDSFIDLAVYTAIWASMYCKFGPQDGTDTVLTPNLSNGGTVVGMHPNQLKHYMEDVQKQVLEDINRATTPRNRHSRKNTNRRGRQRARTNRNRTRRS